jgi:hypothetical protein
MSDIDTLLFNSIRAELNATTSDRATAVLGGSLVEGQLKALLRHVLVVNKRVTEYIEKTDTGDLQTVAFGLGLLPFDHHQDLKLISKIRNKFAHTVEAQSFDQEPIAGWVAALISPRRFGQIQGTVYLLSSGKPAQTLTDMPKRFQFIAAVAAASTTIQHIQTEIRPLSPSNRFYVDPSSGGA